MKYDEAYEYVKDYFQRNFLESYLIFEGRMQYIENMYVSFYGDNIRNQYSVDEIINGNVDDDISKYLDNFVGEYFTKNQREDIIILNNYVKEVLVKRGVNVNFSDDIFEHIVRLVSSRVWSQFDRSRIGKEDFNHIINLVYNNICNQYAKLIDKKIEQILDNRLDYFELRKLGVEKEQLKKFVIGSIFKNGSKNFLVRVKSLIISSDRMLSETGGELNKYINEYFAKYSDKYDVSLNTDVRKDNVNDKEIDVSLDNKDIVGNINNCNNEEIKFNINNMRNNSVKNGLFVDKIRFNITKGQVVKSVALLALLGTLLSVGAGRSDEVKYTDDEYAVLRFGTLSNYDYDRKWVRDDRYFDEMADEVMIVYSKLEQLPNDGYKTIGLYNVYEGFKDVKGDVDLLPDMESFFEMLKKKIATLDIDIGLRDIINVDSKDGYFYLDFVYDQLYNMGFSEIKDSKYQDVLLRYKYANYGNRYGVVGVFLTDSEKRLINDVMIKYEEYCENAKLEIGYLMTDNRYTFFSTYKGNSGRSV